MQTELWYTDEHTRDVRFSMKTTKDSLRRERNMWMDSDCLPHALELYLVTLSLKNVWIISAVVTTFIRTVPLRRILSILE